MPTLRTPQLQQKYHDYLSTLKPNECGLCNTKPLREYTHWLLIENDFPYDKLAEKHLMLVSKRHVVEQDFTPEEQEELRLIKHELIISPEFDMVIEITEPHKTIPPHFHLHIIKLREDI